MSFGAPFPAFRREVTRTFLARSEVTSTTSSYSFAGLNAGAADPDRFLVACVTWQSTAGGAITGCTIGGVAATQIVQSALSGGSRGTAIFIAKVPLGTTATVAFTTSVNGANASVALYSVFGIQSAAAANSASSNAAAPSASIAVANNSVMIAVAAGGSGAPPSASWSGLTEDADNNFGASSLQCRSAASDQFASAQTVNATCTFSASAGSAGCFATFEP